jgi:hypothetical protein
MSEKESASSSAERAGQSKKLKANHGNDQEVCPVCLLDDVPFVKGRCQHNVCLPCLERILSVPVQRRPRDDWNQSVLPHEDAHLDIPTRGRCPMCRKEICLFDLEKDRADDAAEDSSTTDVTLAIEKNHDILATDLKGRVYVRNRSRVGDHSLHFPSGVEVEDATTKQGGGPLLPYVDFSKVEDRELERKLPEKKYFEPDCHFHFPTRTFHGRLRFDGSCSDRVSGSLEWEYAIAFSSDFQFISRGVLIKKRHICSDLACKRLDCKFPLDGNWRVSWPDSPVRSDTTCVVHNNTWIEATQFPLSDEERTWSIRYQEGKYPVIACLSVGVQKSHHNLAEKEIKVGASLEFSPSDPKFHMMWTRETCVPAREHLEVVNFGSESSQWNYRALSVDATNSRSPEYHSDTVWGNTFCQSFKVGLASYHFMGSIEDGAYISYEHEKTSMWPPLDNGNPIPSKIWFTETSFDPETRIFRGKIDWEGTHHTTWQSSRWWRYVLVRTFVVSGFANAHWCLYSSQIRDAIRPVFFLYNGRSCQFGSFWIRSGKGHVKVRS